MAKVVRLDDYRKDKFIRGESQKALACELMQAAAEILHDLDEPDRRIAWILEDCSEILNRGLRAKDDSTFRDSPHTDGEFCEFPQKFQVVNQDSDSDLVDLR